MKSLTLDHARDGEVMIAYAMNGEQLPPQTFVLKSVSVDLPTSDITFPGGAAADAINANCHSAGMVLTQPNLAKAAWAAEVDKMIHAFKAPIDQRNATAIVDYLSETKGAK